MGMQEYLSPGSPAWSQQQIEIRDKCFATAQAEVDVEYYNYKGVQGPDDGIDWAQPVREGLRAAQGEVDLAQQEVDQAETVLRRAKAQLAETQAELARYDDLDERIRNYTVDQLKAGQDTELNYTLKRRTRRSSPAYAIGTISPPSPSIAWRLSTVLPSIALAISCESHMFGRRRCCWNMPRSAPPR
jgi:hypothetical protein